LEPEPAEPGQALLVLWMPVAQLLQAQGPASSVLAVPEHPLSCCYSDNNNRR
jgi:hypothetical protein